MKAYARNFLYSSRYGAIMYCMRYVCYHDHIGRDFVIGQFCVLYGVSIGGGAEIGLVENRQPYYSCVFILYEVEDVAMHATD
jgi:hypothetical protein